MNRLKVVIGGVTVAVLVLFAAYLARDELQYRFVKASISAGMIAPDENPERFALYFCGTGTPRFHADRNQPCLLIVAGETTVLFDAGQGALWAMEAIQAPWINLDAVFLSHLHSDHMSGLGEVIQNGWVAGRRQALDIYGPPGTAAVIDGFRQLYAADVTERKPAFGYEPGQDASAHLWGAVDEVQIDDDDAHVVYAKKGLRISAFRVEHPRWTYAYGYSIEYKGKRVVFSGDTRATEAIVRHAKDADLLVHEAYNRSMMSTVARAVEDLDLNIDASVVEKIASVHTDTLALADIAERASVQRLVITHMIPPIPPNGLAETLFAAGMDEVYKGPLTLARDGLVIEL